MIGSSTENVVAPIIVLLPLTSKLPSTVKLPCIQASLVTPSPPLSTTEAVL